MSLLDQVRSLPQQVMDRLKELEPLAREYDQLRRFAERFGLNYSPSSADGEAEAEPAPSGRGAGTRTRVKQRSARTPAKTARSTRAPGRTRAAKPAATAGARSTSRQNAKATAQPAGASPASAAARKRAASSRGRRSAGRRAGPAAPGQRHDDVLRVLGEHPGITVREIGERLGVDATGLYRVVKRLTEEGRVRKEGARLRPVESTTASSAVPQATGDEPVATGARADVSEESPPAEEGSSATAADSAPTDQT